MAKGRRTGSFSHLLYKLGDAVRFAPDSAFAAPRSESDAPRREKPFLAYRQGIKNALAKTCEFSFFLGLYNAFLRVFFTTRVRAFGVLFFSCGFLQILSYFLSGYFSVTVGDESNLIFGVTMIFLTLLCSFTRGDVKDVFKKSFLFRGILDPLFGTERWEFPAGRGSDNFFVMLLLGMALAFFAVIFSPFALLSVVLLLALILFVFYLPEAGLVTVALTVFSLSFEVTAFFTALTLIAFLCKCAVGRRTIVFSVWDWIVFLCLFPLLFSQQSRLLGLVLGAVYVVALGLLSSLASIRRFLSALTLGSTFCSVMVVLRFVMETFFEKLLFRFPNLDKLLFLRADELTLTPVVMAVPLAVGLFRSSKKTAGSVFFPLVFLLFFAAVFCGASVPLWLALLIALAVQNVMTYRFALIFYAIFGFVLVSAWNAIPPVWLHRALDLIGLASVERTSDGLISVLGVGKVLGILIPVVLLAYFVFAVVRFAEKSTRPAAFPRVLGAIGSVVAFVVLGICSAGADESTWILFFLNMALVRASLICSRREEIRLPY